LSDNNATRQTRALRLRYASHMPTIDDFITSADLALRTLSHSAKSGRPMPRPPGPVHDDDLSAEQRKLSGALMRVNHVGEVCAQALYAAQALSARTPDLRAQMEAAGREEADHLAWTERRLAELGDRTSLGFVVETERQVEAHLASHLQRLPDTDEASRAIVRQMQADETRHADEALQAGATTMPAPVRWLMRSAARVMTRTAHHI
jgi:ubiquinone biosynthesis monooxygenase Coq7